MKHAKALLAGLLPSAALALSAQAAGSAAPAAPQTRPPNFIFFIVDDMEKFMANFLPEGNGKNLTPNLDRLAAEGVLMLQQHVVSPLCTPSRYNCLTGRYASRASNDFFQQATEDNEGQTKVEFNSHITKSDVTLPKLLQKAGYKTGMVGKNHVVELDQPMNLKKIFPNYDASARDPENVSKLKANYDHVCQAIREVGFDYAASVYHNNPDFLGLSEVAVQNMDWITKGGLDFLDQFGHEPFYLYFATTVPHGPSKAERSWNANPLITPIGYLDAPLTVQPARETIPARLAAAGIPLTDPAANMLWVDDAIGALLTRLEEKGVLDNTVIFFFNDQGQDSKGTLYQGGVHNPISIVWRKGGFPAGHTCEARVSNIDFAPTILDMAGAAYAPGTFDGESFLPYLNGKPQAPGRVLYHELGFTRAVQKGPWKYLALSYPAKFSTMTMEERQAKLDEWNAERIRKHLRIVTTNAAAGFSHLTAHPGGGDAERSSTGAYPGYYEEHQLYDLSQDPEEQNNLANNPEYSAKLEEMKAEMKAQLNALPGRFGELKN